MRPFVFKVVHKYSHTRYVFASPVAGDPVLSVPRSYARCVDWLGGKVWVARQIDAQRLPRKGARRDQAFFRVVLR